MVAFKNFLFLPLMGRRCPAQGPSEGAAAAFRALSPGAFVEN